jgi:hypothetical protein
VLVNWLGWIWLLGLGLRVFVLLLFPREIWPPAAGGRWPGPPGRAGWVLGNAFAPTILTTSPSPPNPVGVSGLGGDIFKVMAAVGVELIAATGLAAVLSLAFRYRHAREAERAQLKWLVYAGALIVAAPARRGAGRADHGPGQRDQ